MPSIPSGSYVVEPQPAKDARRPVAFVKLSQSALDAIMKASPNTTMSLDLRRDQNVMIIGTEKFQITRNDFQKAQETDVYKVDAASRTLAFEGNPSERFTVKASAESLRKLAKQSADAEALKKTRKTKLIDAQEEAAKTTAKKVAPSRSRTAKATTEPVKPREPEKASTQPAVSLADLQRKIVHFLAPKANSESAIAEKFPAFSKEEIVSVLQKVATPQLSRPDMWQLTPVGYGEFDPEYPDYDEDTRVTAIQQWNVATHQGGRPGGKGKRKREEEPIVFKVQPPSNVPPPPPAPEPQAGPKAKKAKTAAKKKPTAAAAKRAAPKEPTPPPVQNHSRMANAAVVTPKPADQRNPAPVKPATAPKNGVRPAREAGKVAEQPRNGKMYRSMSLDSLESNVTAGTSDRSDDKDSEIANMSWQQLENEWNKAQAEQSQLQEKIQAHLEIGNRIEALVRSGKNAAEVNRAAEKLWNRGAGDYLEHLGGLMNRFDGVQARLVRIRDRGRPGS
ncbi:hypothetical protein HDV00_008017 [Rhizophlyctis rosea]|nr:hypothetical protein HDV00_008017 [Rhizophlyctis rosea]